MRKPGAIGDLRSNIVLQGSDMKKAVLAFSGGLDTSFCVVYLKEELGYDVISVTVDTGGFSKEEIERIKERASSLGVKKHITIDATKFVYERFISYIVKGNSLRGNVYPLSVGAERVAQAIEISKTAVREKADAVCHGSTGAGNDQIRFDVAFRALIPEKKLLTPIRELGLSREQEADKLAAWGFPVEAEVKDYSINEGIWGTTIGGKQTHDSWDFPPDTVFKHTKNKDGVALPSREVVISFKGGLPVEIDGEKLSGVDALRRLNETAGGYGIGRGVHVGDTILGIKGRIVFEAPAPVVLIAAHRELEKLVLSKHQRFWKDHLGQVYGDMLHEGLYFDPLMRDIEAMLDSSQESVSGRVRALFMPGSFLVTGTESEYSLMKSDLATYGEVQSLWDSRDAEGFSRIYGIPARLFGIVHKDKWL
jgi:argininosuccinate synthase